MSASTNIEKAKAALIYFHNASTRYDDYPFGSVKELYDYINTQNPSFLSSFGASLGYANLSETKVSTGMEALANQGQGKLPKTFGDFFNFLLDQTKNIKWSELAEGAAIDSAKQFIQGANEVGKAAYTGVVSTLGFMPLILGGAVILFVVLKAKHA